MIYFYNILNDQKGYPVLNVLKEIDLNNKNVSIEESIDILINYENINLLNVEHAYIIGYNNQMDITGIFLVSIGNTRQCYFYKKSIATFLILTGSEKFLIFHNHPDGNIKPSENDYLSLIQINNLANILEVDLIDSVIITKNGWNCINKGLVIEYEDDEF